MSVPSAAHCFSRARRLVLAALVCLLGLIASACSEAGELPAAADSTIESATEPADDQGSDVDDDSAASETESAVDDAGVPEALPFVSQTLRVSVPTLDFVAPYLVDETDPVEVFVTDLLSDGLTSRDAATGEVNPAVASSWSTSEDGLEWTFTLSDAQFGSGEAITAEDVVASLNRVAEQGIRSISGPNLWPVAGWIAAGDGGGAVAGIVAVDGDTVQFTLTEPFAPLPEVLAGVGFGIWPEALDQSDAAASAFPVSSSIEYTPTSLWADGIRLSAPDDVAADVSTIELFVDPTNSLLEAGETDMTINLDPEDELGDLVGATVPRSAEAFFGMNTEVAPLGDPMIRQAIVHAVDRAAIRDEFFPDAGIMQNFLSEHSAGGEADQCGDRCDFDREQAELLVEASPNSDVAFTVDYFADPNDSDDTEQRLAEQIASQLREVGLSATAQGHTPEEFSNGIGRGELGLFRFGAVSTVLSAEAEIAARFATDGRDNLTGTSIERVDELIAQAREIADTSERAELYEQAEVVLFNEAVVLPLVEFRHHLAHGPSLVAVGLEVDGSLDLSAIEFATAAE